MHIPENLSLKFLYYEGILLGLPFVFCPQRKIFVEDQHLSIWSTIVCLMIIFITLISTMYAETLYYVSLLDADFLISLLGYSNQVLFSLHVILNLF